MADEGLSTDADGDGQLMRSELPEPFQQRFEQLVKISDRDGDGRLTEGEFPKNPREDVFLDDAGRQAANREGSLALEERLLRREEEPLKIMSIIW